jgi:hypothetical protein
VANGFLNATSIKLIFVEDFEMMNEQISGDSPIVNGKSLSLDFDSVFVDWYHGAVV